MNIRSTRLKRVATGMAALAAAATTVVVGAGSASVTAAPAGTPPTGGLDIVPGSGNSGSSFQLAYESGVADQFCTGDGTQGWRWNTFIVELGTDPATLTYPAPGLATDPGGNFAFPLFDSGGTVVVSQFPGTGDGFVNIGAVTFDFAAPGFSTTNGFPGPGQYELGFACVDTANNQTDEYWSTTMTVTANGGDGANGFDFAEGTLAVAPTLDSAVGGDGEITANFTPGASDPAATSFEVTLDDGVNPVITQTGAASPITVTGVPYGTYDVSVTATNSVGTSASSNVLSAVSSPSAQPAPTNVTATAVPGGDVDVSWTAPAGETATRSGYEVTANDGVNPPVVQSLGAAATSTTFSGLTVGTTYTFTVQALYPAPDVGTPASDAATVVPNAVIQQDITAERPEGALIFTQRCGVNDAASGLAANQWGGFWAAGLPAIAPSGDQTGVAPIDLNTSSPDTNFPEYPYPIDELTGLPNPNYTTACGIDLGRAELVTEAADPFRGQFFRADGRLDQITVVDTRDNDDGWVLTGTMGTFSDGAGQTFSGDYLGWIPDVAEDSGANPISGYDQTVTAGPGVQPAIPGGLADGETLASAPAGAGLGISEHDARIMLLIPVSADAGSYTGVLTFTVA